MTIEEKATQLAYHEVWENCDTEFRTYIDEEEKKMYIDILTEQDTIARNEERERCIKAACKWLEDNGWKFGRIDYKDILEDFRKAMEV